MASFWINTPLKVGRIQQLLEGSPFTGFTGGLGRLGQGHTKGVGIDRHLGDRAVTAVLSLNRKAPQGFAVKQQLAQTVGPPEYLADHPGLEHLAKFLKVGLIEHVEDAGI